MIKRLLLRYMESSRPVTFECSPEYEGKAAVACAAVMAVGTAADMMTDGGTSDPARTVCIVLSLGVALYGLYYWLLRRRPITRSVEEGSRAFRLYHGHRVRYALYLLVRVLISMGIWAVLLILFAGKHNLRGDDGMWYFIGQMTMLTVLRLAGETLTFYMYDRSPVSGRHALAEGIPGLEDPKKQ